MDGVLGAEGPEVGRPTAMGGAVGDRANLLRAVGELDSRRPRDRRSSTMLHAKTGRKRGLRGGGLVALALLKATVVPVRRFGSWRSP
jgi:hypothetical protein